MPRIRRRSGTGRRGVARGATAALEEDRYRADRTTQLLLRARIPGEARVIAQASGRLSGTQPARACARTAGLRVIRSLPDGSPLRRGTEVMTIRGDARRMLGAERTILNYLMHLSGVATAAERAVRAVRATPHPPEIWATRKTIPGMRDLEKAAVVDGGGHAHRRDLSGAVLVKNNHLVFVPLARALARLERANRGERMVQVEVRSAREAIAVARAGVRRMLIDNASPARAHRIVRALERAGLRSGRWVELSGGITVENARRYRAVGADALSLGSLTHSAPALPFRMRMRPRATGLRRGAN